MAPIFEKEFHCKNDSYNLHKKLKQLSGYGKRSPDTLVYDDGKLVIDANGQMLVWEKYVTGMFDVQRVAMEPNSEDIDGPAILKNIIYAINNLTDNISNGRYSPIITRLKLNHGHFSAYFHKLRRKDTVLYKIDT